MAYSIHCHVSGKVQGVWFRAWTREQALELNLNGWVRNLPDGRVECLAQGGKEEVEEFRRRLHQGPPYSDVRDVACKPVEPDGKLTEFFIRY